MSAYVYGPMRSESPIFRRAVGSFPTLDFYYSRRSGSAPGWSTNHYLSTNKAELSTKKFVRQKAPGSK